MLGETGRRSLYRDKLARFRQSPSQSPALWSNHKNSRNGDFLEKRGIVLATGRTERTANTNAEGDRTMAETKSTTTNSNGRFEYSGGIAAQVDVERRCVVVCLPLMLEPQPTSTGKSMMVAKTQGQEAIGVSIGGKRAFLSAQVYVR